MQSRVDLTTTSSTARELLRIQYERKNEELVLEATVDPLAEKLVTRSEHIMEAFKRWRPVLLKENYLQADMTYESARLQKHLHEQDLFKPA